MSTSASPIREFLVSLGFKNDEAGLRRFENGIEKATKTVVKFTAAVAGAVAGVSFAVYKFSDRLERLYFNSLKARASAVNLRAVDLAFQNLGAESGEAVSAVQSLARLLRENPGSEGLLNALGVQTRNAKGELLDTVDVMANLGDYLKDQPYFLAKQWADQFGVSENVLLAMRRGGYREELEKQRKALSDSGLKKATEDAHRFMVMTRDLGRALESFGIRVYEALVKKLNTKSLTDWLEKNGPWLAEKLIEYGSLLIDVGKKAFDILTWVFEKLKGLDKKTLTVIAGLLVAMKLFGSATVLTGVFRLIGLFTKLTAAMTGASVAAGGVATGVAAVAAAAGGYALGTYLYDNVLSQDTKDSVGKWVARIMSAFSSEARDAFATNDPVEFYQGRGWTRDQAVGIVANLQAESNMNPKARNGSHVGIAQWDKNRQEDFRRRYGHSVEEGSISEQMDFVDYELRIGNERVAGALLRGSKNIEQSTDAMLSAYMRPGAETIDRDGPRRQRIANSIQQKIDIHVNGARDPVATGKAVVNEQERAYERLAREFGPVAD